MEPTGSGGMEYWHRYLDDYVPSESHRHESYALQACRLAVDAVECGSYGVGAVLLDADGEVVVEGHNRVRTDGFRSDLHAEMVVLNAYEALGLPRGRARNLTLVTSLEPCPMCVARLIVAGIGTVLHISDDPAGGMVRNLRNLPPIFRTITEHHEQAWGSAECSEELRAAAFKIWVESRDLLGRSRPDQG